MNPAELASQSAGVRGVGYIDPDASLPWTPPVEHPRLRSVARHWRLYALVLLGAALAAAVGYLTAQNPHASPAHVAVPLRVAVILVLVLTGAYAQTIDGRERLGVLLVATGLFTSLWLLNGASESILFSIGLLLGGMAPPLFAYLMVAYPSGRLRSSAERRLLVYAGAAMVLLWTFLILTSSQPPLRTPLLSCGHHCPQNAFFLGSSGSEAATVARVGLWISWIALAGGTPVLLFAVSRKGAEPLRRSYIPVKIAAVGSSVLLLGFAAFRIAGARAASALGAAYIEMAVVIPLAILAGLFVERLSMGRALATFVRRLAEQPQAAPEALLADALKDPSVEIAYYDPGTGTHADAGGRRVKLPERDADRAVAHIERYGAPIAAVSYDADMSDQAAFVEAAGAVALMHVEAARLEADLIKVNRELAASRLRLVEAADNERQRIERDLHDGVQQHIVGLRLRLDLAAEAIHDDPARGEQMVAAIGRQVDDLLAALRSFAAGIYPTILTERGIKDALESAVRNLPCPVSLHTFGVRRYREDVEVAVYFCCLEALQNIVKHAGPDPDAGMRLWEIGEMLVFEVRDSGVGFDPLESPPGSGLINMHDRTEAIGGALQVSSQKGRGTRVRGRVPLSGAST